MYYKNKNKGEKACMSKDRLLPVLAYELIPSSDQVIMEVDNILKEL